LPTKRRIAENAGKMTPQKVARRRAERNSKRYVLPVLSELEKDECEL
jgi:hypothetical protein